MPNSIRQQIFTKIKTRFQSILISNDYNTNLGTYLETWRCQPYSEEELAEHSPKGNLIDPDEETENVLMGHVNGTQQHTLKIIVRIVMSDSTDVDALAKKAIADVTKAIGVDTRFDGLVIDTLPGKTSLDMEQKKKKIAAFDYEFSVKYRTRRFDPYNQS